MLISAVIALIGVFSTLCAAAVLPARQEPPPSSPPATPPPACTPIYITVTVTDAPDTVTIAAVDSASIDRQFSTQASIDTNYVIDDRLHRPTGQTPDPNPTQYTHTAAAPLYEATEAPNDGTSVYYVPKPNDGPTASTPVAVTTITVIPTPAASPPPQTPQGESGAYSALSNTTNRNTTSTVASGWNISNSSLSTSAGGYGFPFPTSVSDGNGTSAVSSLSFDVLTTTVTTFVSTRTKNVTSLTTASTIVNGSFFPGFGIPSSLTSSEPVGLVPRQTCTLVDAGPFGTWCNNWNGHTVVSYSTYNTTVYPKAWSTRQPTVVTVTITDSEPEAPTPETSIPPSSPEVSAPAPTPEASPSNTEVAPSTTEVTPPATNTAPFSNTTVPAEPTNNTQPESCGEVGPFTIDFETFPDSSPNPPIFNPWRHFWWGAFWTYAPPPVQAYPPQDGTHLAKCNPSNNNILLGSPNAGDVPADGFGAGPRFYTDTYWFNAHSAYVACDNPTSDPRTVCEFNATAWKSDGFKEYIFESHPYLIAPCANNMTCHLQEITFPGDWNNLTTLNFTATVAGETRGFYLDALSLGWSNNSCAAGLTRVNSRK